MKNKSTNSVSNRYSAAVFSKIQNVFRSSDSLDSKLLSTMRWLAKWRSQTLHDEVMKRQDLKVQGGPFKGMNLPDYGHEGSFVAKWLGAYEPALHPVIYEIYKDKYDLILNIGASDGYYAVGLALNLPDSEVWHTISRRKREQY